MTLRKAFKPSFVLAHLLLVALVVAIVAPGKVRVNSYIPLLVACGVIEALVLWRYFCTGKPRVSVSRVAVVVWLIMLVWELFATDLKITHAVLVPLPENVFLVFAEKWQELGLDVISSLTLLGEGLVAGVVAGVIIGLFVGWLPSLRETVYPIAHVLAPVPAIVFAPYLVLIMPSFSMAAATIIFLGIFWPTLLNTILRVESIDRNIIDSARMLGLSPCAMIMKVLLPYMYPSFVSGLKTQLPAAMMMLTFAEMYGAQSGLGYFIINYTNYANYTNVVAGIIMVGVVVTILDSFVGLLQRKTVKWR